MMKIKSSKFILFSKVSCMYRLQDNVITKTVYELVDELMPFNDYFAGALSLKTLTG